MKKQNLVHYSILFLILLAAIAFRIANLDKPHGLWLDEIITFNTANKTSALEILNNSLTSDMHAPFYYILLFFWMKLFGDADLTLRFFSVIPGVLTIFFLYLTGKELEDKKTGLCAAGFGAINSLLIYYSQEVRFYSLLAFLSILIIYFAIKIFKNPSKWNYTGFIISNILLLYTHTIGFVFVFFEILVFGIYILVKKKELLKGYILSSFIIAASLIPYSFHLFNMVKSPATGIFSQWWCEINFSKILFSIGDLFSPLLVNIYGTHMDYTDFLFLPANIIISIIPSLIALIGLIAALKSKNTFVKLIFLICLGFLTVFTGAYFKGKVVFITRYIIEISPLLILVFTYGLLKIKNQLISLVLIYIYIFITLSCFLIFETSAFNDKRISGFKTPVTFLQKHKLDKDSKIASVFYRKSWFSKYYPENQGGALISIDWTTSPKFLPEEYKLYKNFTKERYYSKLKPFISGQDTNFYQVKIEKEFIEPLQSGKYFVILCKERFHGFDNEKLKEITQDDSKYINSQMALMLFSRFTQTLIDVCDSELKFIEKQEEHGWELYFYQKP